MTDIKNDYRILKDYHHFKNEDARMVLPNACFTEFYITMNARSLIEMSHLRMCSRAQAEIRSYLE
ncbi:MAG: FAD-dependent thymidylate synthase [Streptococcus sp.]